MSMSIKMKATKYFEFEISKTLNPPTMKTDSWQKSSGLAWNFIKPFITPVEKVIPK